MKLIKKIKNLFKNKEIKEPINEKECKNDEYCPIYLSHADKYGEKSEHVKYCKNSNKQYCTKYRLIEETEWKKLDKDQKLKVIKDMNLIEFIDEN